MLHNDAINLSEFGEQVVVRASHVEWTDGTLKLDTLSVDGNVYNCTLHSGWYVQSAVTLRLLADGFDTRAEALAWEKEYYSPSGKGWTELTQEGN